MRIFDKDDTTLFLDPEAVPVAVLESGERIVVRTEDSICGLWRSHVPEGLHIDEVLDTLGGACPLTGPFAVAGAARGDVLEVEIHRVDPVPAEGTAWTGVFAGFGALGSETYNVQAPLGSELREVPYREGVASLSRGSGMAAIPLRPFLGTLAVAPRWERRMTFSQSPEYLGDVDLPQLGSGATVVLPVNVEGGLLALGDAHGAQGDGEITGAAIEIEAETELTVRVRSREETGFMSLPQLNTAETIGSVAGMYGVPLGDCARAAYTDLVKRLVRGYGFSTLEAYQLLGQVGRLQVGNMIDPFYSVLASVERCHLG